MWIYMQYPGEPERLVRSCVKLASWPWEQEAAIPWSTINGTETETWTKAKNTSATTASPHRFFPIENMKVAIGVYVFVYVVSKNFWDGNICRRKLKPVDHSLQYTYSI